MSDVIDRLRDILEEYRHVPPCAESAHMLYDELCQLVYEYDDEEEG